MATAPRLSPLPTPDCGWPRTEQDSWPAIRPSCGWWPSGLAERLDLVTTYLADLKDQYGDAPGLSMVADVLSTLSQHPGTTARPGSARDPDPEY